MMLVCPGFWGQGLRLQRPNANSMSLLLGSAAYKTSLRETTKPSFICTHSQRNYQELKESLAYLISTNSSSHKQLLKIHCQIISLGLHHNLFLASLLISEYSSFKDLLAARSVIDSQISKSKTLLWNSLIRGYSNNGQYERVLGVYHEMEAEARCPPDNQTFNLVIKACTQLSEFELGSQVHAHARSRGVELDLLVGTALVDMYCKFEDLKTARQLFVEMPTKDVVTWNVIIAGYSREGAFSDVLDLFHTMRFDHRILPTEATLISLVLVCGDSGSLKIGKVFHALAIKIGFEGDISFCNSLMEMYSKCNCLNITFKLFHIMTKDAVSWSTMIAAYVQNGHAFDAVKLFHRMIQSKKVLPTRSILINVLLASAGLGDWQSGKWVEEEFIKGNKEWEHDIGLNTTLMYMYTRCGHIETSFGLLEKISQKREVVIVWNAMLKACVELQQVDWVSKLLLEMRTRSIKLDRITILTLVPLISKTASMRKAMEVHSYIIKNGFGSERSIANSLIDMYAKCGSIEASHEIFNGIQNKDVVSWSSIIKGYAWNGNGIEAISLFMLMQESGMRPNHITFTTLLSACSHCGFVEKGRELFECMKEYGLEPTLEQYSCMVDLLGRAGFLCEAYQLTTTIPMEANATVLGALLSSCRIHGNWLIGEKVAWDLFNLEPGNPANYIMLASIYTIRGRREDANEVLRLLREKDLKKNSSWSRVERDR